MDKFTFYAPAYLIKSGKTAGDGKEYIRVGGVISTEDKDSQNEILLSKGLDLSYFESGWGKIKYEHDDPNMRIEPDNIIGFPVRVFRKGGETHFEGRLIPFDPSAPESSLTPQQRLAKSAFTLMNAIEENNRNFPDSPQKIGWSIEGSYLAKPEKGTGIIRKARVNNVVLTTKPVNMNTCAAILKSLSVGYEHGSVNQSGFGATRQESLDNSVKFQTLNPEKEIKKMQFNSKEECYKYYLKQGLGPDEAMAKANEWEKSQGAGPDNGNPADSQGELEKSAQAFSRAQNELIKSIDAKKFEPVDIEGYQKQFKKSLTTGDDGEVDLSGYMQTKTDSDLKLMEVVSRLNEKVDVLSKALSVALVGFETMAKSLGGMDKIGRMNSSALLRLMKSNGAVSFAPSDLIKNVQFDDNSSNPDEGKLSKSEMLATIDKLFDEGKISGTDVVKAELHLNKGMKLDPRVDSLVRQNLRK